MTSAAATRRPDGTPKKATSINALRTSIREFCRYLHASGILNANPARLLRRARCSPAPPRALSDAGRERFLAILDEATAPEEVRDRALFRLLLLSGLRLGSALGLDVDNLRLEQSEVLVRRAKNDAPVMIFVPAAVAGDLARLAGGRSSGPLFTTSTGRRLGHRQAQRRFTALARRAGLPPGTRPHDLRHSFATQLYAETGDLGLVQRALAHRSVLSTTVYARVAASAVRKAVSTLGSA